MTSLIENDATDSQLSLPTPADRPLADVVIYDGKCRICATRVDTLNRWDRKQRLAYLSLHDPIVQQVYPDLSQEDLMRDMYVVERSGRKHQGAAALRYLSRRLPQLWWLAPVLHIPFSLPLWQFLYRQVASRRYRFGTVESCDSGSCAVSLDKR